MTYEEIAEILAKHPVAVVATVVATQGSAPRDPGARMVVLPDGKTFGTVGGGTLEQTVIEDALALFSTGSTLRKMYGLKPESQGGIGMVCGGESEVFLEVMGVQDRCLILGGGHIGLALHEMGRLLGWETAIVDDREAFAEADRFPGAREVRCAPYDDPSLRDLVTKKTAAVIVTHAHTGDRAALGTLAGTPAFYLGMIGSSRKVKTILDSLVEEGVEASALAGVHAPIGLDLDAQTPAEIALSIWAEILACRQGLGPEILTVKEAKARARKG